MKLFLIILSILPFMALSQEHVSEFVTQIAIDDLEVSGIISTEDDRIFVIGDSGNDAEVHEINRSGEVLNTIYITNAENVDWEEMQLDSDGNLYIADIGNNLSQRTDLVIYKIPNFTDSLHLSYIDYAEEILFTYENQTSVASDPNGEFDAEAFIVLDQEIHVFSKDHSQQNQTNIYSLPINSGSYTAQLIYTLNNDQWLTGVFYDSLTDRIFFTSVDGVRSFKNYTSSWLAEESCSAQLEIFENLQIESLVQLSTGEFLVAEDVEDDSKSNLFSLFTSCKDDFKLLIGPNPSDHALTIRSERFIKQIKIYSENGQLVWSKTYTESVKHVEIDVSQLNSEAYVLKVISDNITLIERIIKL